MIFAFAGIAYLWLAVQVSRESTDSATASVSYFLFLIGAMVMGSAFSFGTTDASIYGIGRVLAYFSAGFLPVVLYVVYREYTVSPANPWVIALFCIVPVVSTLLAATNSWHHLAWSVTETEHGITFSEMTESSWFRSVHAPFAYSLFGYSIIAMAGRLPTITRAHRKKILLLLTCAILPFAVNAGNTLLGIGPIGFPFTSSTLVLLLPAYWWVSKVLRVHSFSPLAYQTMFDHVRDPIFVLDDRHKIISANRPAQELLEATEGELIGQGLWEDLPAVKAALTGTREEDLKKTVRLQSDRFFELNVAPLAGQSGRPQGTVVICRDITARKQAQSALEDSERLIRSIVEQSSNGILRFARDDLHPDKYRCTFANQAAERFLHSDGSPLVGMSLEELTVLQPRKLISVFGGDGRTVDLNARFEIEAELDDGCTWVRMVCEPVGSDFSVMLIDITARKHNESKILADALRDPLTGVFNRRGFEQLAAERLASCKLGAVFYLDLNNFKSINDSFGHRAGDALLKAFGHRLESCLRPEDILARVGGDEFVIVLPEVTVEEAKFVAGRLIETASEAYIIQGQKIDCSASVGIAFTPQHGDDLWHLVSVADEAMYNAKAFGEGPAANDRSAYIEAAISS